MSGIYPDAGFIYQRKVLIYHILESLLKHDLAECQIELTFPKTFPNENEGFSIDFYISTNHQIHRCFEVKDRISSHLNKQLQKIIQNFYKIYSSHNNTECVLIHSMQATGKLSKLYDPIKKTTAINRMIGDIRDLEEFCDSITIKHMHNEVDSNLYKSEIDLRSIGLIDKILKEYDICRCDYAESIYESSILFFENSIMSKANGRKKFSQKRYQNYPTHDSIIVNLKDFLDTNNGFVDKIYSEKKSKPSKNDKIQEFCTRFNIPIFPTTRIQT